MRFDGLHVLFVEDEMILAAELEDELSALGVMTIGVVTSVNSAIEYLDQNGKIDAAVTNVQLRGKLSFPVADALIARNIPFIFVTANDALVREHYPDVPCCPKPSEVEKVLQALRDMIDAAPTRHSRQTA